MIGFSSSRIEADQRQQGVRRLRRQAGEHGGGHGAIRMIDGQQLIAGLKSERGDDDLDGSQFGHIMPTFRPERGEI
jgi:hypothetical protein